MREESSEPKPQQTEDTAVAHLTLQSESLAERRRRRHEALESIRAGIINNRGSLDGLLDEFLAERREEARREMEGD
jgi:hypothetical protein